MNTDDPHPLIRAGASQLEALSNGLYRALRKLLPTADMPMLEKAFDLALTSGDRIEIPLMRPEGASFNPRPGRLGKILISEGGISSSSVLIAAFYCCCEKALLDSLPRSPSIDAALRLAAESRRFLLKAGEASSDAEKIALAMLLDDVRHLHMSTLSPQARREICDRATLRILPAISSAASAKLKQMVESAVERFIGRRPQIISL